MKIGYSHWGFLGDGITDTPDGGRSHRKTLVDGLVAAGHQVVFLQADRDTLEAHRPVPGPYVWDAGLPELDALFLEWRWPIPGRNDTPCGTPGHTCDLHRQQQLVSHYVEQRGTPALLWDKDQQLHPADALRQGGNVTVCEPALHPRPGAQSLLFPVADQVLDQAEPSVLAAHPRHLALVYVGNEYGRTDAFTTYFAPAAHDLPHEVAGKWADTGRWPHVTFLGRVPFRHGIRMHQAAHATVLLAPDRYLATGQYTQRIFEAVLTGCAPITPARYRSAATVVPEELHARDGADVADITRRLAVLGGEDRARLLAQCLRRLDPFRLSRQLDTIDTVLN
ncbi:hypothetical protein [Streptomyces sp. TLI_146]|uniref:hypothetical protein n=1 Tax=Streptomyces sp. TLI_146 TaxID=1938858 RepID=UPI000C70284D|nr:hypothetical protein [Streptomyces sp. TLI_146]PKV84232.1 hypothetical protein BX283_1743 [Streptomyces sp. TLI_146]